MKSTICAVVLGCMGLSACTPLATYPPDSRTLRPESVVNEPIPSLIVESIRYADGRYGTGDEFAIDLPAGSSAWLYEKITTRLGKGHVLTAPGEPAYYVTKVRARGMNGDVDIFIPDADGTYRFATLSFNHQGFRGWQHQGTRWWQTGEQPPAPNYVVAKPQPGPDEVVIEQPVLAHD